MDNTRLYYHILNLHSKCIRAHHHLHIARSYLQANKVPAALQISLLPSIMGIPSNRFLYKWNAILHRASIFLLSHIEQHLVNFIQECQHTLFAQQRVLLSAYNDLEISHFYDNISQFVVRLNCRLIHKRSRKFQRDGIVPAPILHHKPKRKTRRYSRKASNKQSSSNQVVNISSTVLTAEETSLLSKGLGFCPRPKDVNRLSLLQEVASFSRRLRLKERFYVDTSDQDDSTVDNPNSPVIQTNFVKKSNWIPPPSKSLTLEAFIQAVEKDVTNLDTKSSHDNLTANERKALQNLKNNGDIVIKPADKGSAVVVMDTQDYIAEAGRQPSNANFYIQTDTDLTKHHAKLVCQTLSKMVGNNEITEEQYNYLVPENPKAGRFYLLPKIHKEGNPGRPIISANGHPTEKISEFVDYHLRDSVKELPSYLQDTTHFLNRISHSSPVQPGTTLATMDVTSLYTNIPHAEGIKACKEALDLRPVKIPSTECLVILIELVLKLNNFTFNGKHYLQINGTAMGTRMAPSYANIFMGRFESYILSNNPLSSPTIWLRYIDDVFILWTDSDNSLLEFVAYCNSLHDTIKFTHESSTDSINFLDTAVSIENNIIHTDIYSKPTDKHQYLLPSSCHPRHITRNIPYSLAIRVKRICSKEQICNNRLNELSTFLRNRNYKQVHIRESFNQVADKSRENLLQYKTKTTNNRVPFVITYHPDIPNPAKIINQHWHLIEQDQKLHKIFPEKPVVAYKRPKSLRDILVRACLPPDGQHATDIGCSPCGDKRCHTCRMMVKATSFTSTSTGRTRHITCNANCKTANVIYLLQCGHCSIQYVGETETPFHIRMNNHRSYYRSNRSCPVTRHCRTNDHPFDNIKVYIIDHNSSWSTQTRQIKESYWIFQAETLSPAGLNDKDGTYVHGIRRLFRSASQSGP